jgi:C4-dicarboxylate transporter DctM subunit
MDFMIVIILLGFLAMGIPVAFALAATSIFFCIFVANIPLVGLVQRLLGGLDSFPLVAIPFFLLAGEIMNVGGITDRTMKLANALVGHIRGGLGHVMVVASMIFAGMTGSSMAEAAGLGKVGIIGMKRQGFSSGFSAALTATSAIIGPVIPPSISVVIYGGITGVSIGRLFLGGAIPGVIMGLSLMVAVYIISKRRNYPCNEKAATPKELGSAFAHSGLALITPVIIVGGILSGVFTPTEAAAVAVLYAILVAGIIYREFPFSMSGSVLTGIGARTASLLFIIAAATPYGYMLTLLQIPQKTVLFFTSLTDNPLVFLTIFNILIIFIGCFMEGLTAMIILIPIFQPVITAYNIDPVHFGMIFNLAICIGLATPPLGMNMFITTSIAKIDIKEYTREALPLLLALVVVLFLITYIPWIVLFLPNTLMSTP